MPLLDHLIELRKRLIYALLGFFAVFFVTFYFAKPIFSFLIQPAVQDGYKVSVFDIFEFFFVTVKLSAFVSLIVGFPLIAVQIWLFVAPGLYRKEKRAFLPFLIATPFMFYAGCAVMYYIVLPYVINLMLAHYVPPDIEKTLRSSDYLSRILQLVVAFIIAAVLTPPDVVSQLALAVPLLAFYEISILIGSWIEKKQAEEDKKAEEAENKGAETPGS